MTPDNTKNVARVKFGAGTLVKAGRPGRTSSPSRSSTSTFSRCRGYREVPVQGVQDADSQMLLLCDCMFLPTPAGRLSFSIGIPMRPSDAASDGASPTLSIECHFSGILAWPNMGPEYRPPRCSHLWRGPRCCFPKRGFVDAHGVAAPDEAVAGPGSRPQEGAGAGREGCRRAGFANLDRPAGHRSEQAPLSAYQNRAPSATLVQALSAEFRRGESGQADRPAAPLSGFRERNETGRSRA